MENMAYFRASHSAASTMAPKHNHYDHTETEHDHHTKEEEELKQMLVMVAGAEETLKELLKEKNYLVGHTLKSSYEDPRYPMATRKSRFALKDDHKSLQTQLSVITREVREMHFQLKKNKNEQSPAQTRQYDEYRMMTEQAELELKQAKLDYEAEMVSVNKYMQTIERQAEVSEIHRQRRQLQQLHQRQITRHNQNELVLTEEEQELGSLTTEVEEYMFCEEILQTIMGKAWKLIEERHSTAGDGSYTLKIGTSVLDDCYESFLKNSPHAHKLLENLQDTDELILQDNTGDSAQWLDRSTHRHRSPSPRSRRLRDAHGVTMDHNDKEMLGFAPIPSTLSAEQALERDNLLLGDDIPVFLNSADERHTEVSDAIGDALASITSSLGRPAIADPTYPLPSPMGAHVYGHAFFTNKSSRLSSTRQPYTRTRTRTPGVYSQSGRGFKWPATSRGEVPGPLSSPADPVRSDRDGQTPRGYGRPFRGPRGSNTIPRPPTAPVSSHHHAHTGHGPEQRQWWDKRDRRSLVVTERPPTLDPHSRAREPRVGHERSHGAKKNTKNKESKHTFTSTKNRASKDIELYKQALWRSHNRSKPSKLQFIQDAQEALITQANARPPPPSQERPRKGKKEYLHSNRLPAASCSAVHGII